tara:strand:+ start:4678 stop:5481 length:804 start_codon:yes stop_codon:yes gene_type:complete
MEATTQPTDATDVSAPVDNPSQTNPSATPEATTTPTTFLEQKNTVDWTTTVPDKFKNESGINHEGIFKSYTELEGKLGKYGLPPESADKYEYEYIPEEGNPLALDAEVFTNMKTLAHALGLSQKQFEPFAKGFDEYSKTLVSTVQDKLGLTPEAQTAKTEETLKQIWKSDDILDKNMGLAFKGLEAYSNELGISIDDVGNNPVAIRLLAKIGSSLGEDKGALGDVATQQSLEDLMYSPAYLNAHHKDHARINSRVNELRSQGYTLKR